MGGEPMACWYETYEGKQRLLREQEDLKRYFPGFYLNILEDGTVVAEGWLGPTSQLQNSYHLVCEYPSHFGNGNRIRVYCLNENFPSGTPHLYPVSDQEICYEHGEFTSRDGIAQCLGMVSQWFVLYEHWRQTGERW